MNNLWRVFTLDLYINKIQHNQSWKINQLLLSGPKEGPMCHKHANKNRQEKVFLIFIHF